MGNASHFGIKSGAEICFRFSSPPKKQKQKKHAHTKKQKTKTKTKQKQKPMKQCSLHIYLFCVQ